MPTDIHALVFSKDRACQLDAFLRSAQAHAPYASVTVLAHASTERHADAYWPIRTKQLIIWDWDGIESYVRWWLAHHERVVFHTDDEVFFRTPPAELFDGDPAIVVTLRQGRNTTYCHPLGVEQKVPEIFPWKWRDAEYDFGYPLSLNATVYQSADILPLLDFHFTNPTELDETMNFPEEWRLALRWGLANDWCTGQPQAIMDKCEKNAATYLMGLEDWDVEDAPTRMEIDNRAYSNGNFV